MEENISNVVSGASPIVNSKKVVGRKQDRDTALGVFTSETERPGVSRGDKNTCLSELSRKSLLVTRDSLISPTATDSGTGTPGSSKSPVRKPMPINEPKPILPKSKQIDLCNSVTKEKICTNEDQKQIEKRRNTRVANMENIKWEVDKSETEESRILKRSSSPLSPSLKSKTRPSTLILDKREKFKRCSALSVTPSTDSNKSSKTFEIIDYDEETKEKILQEALIVEEEFLEFVKTLDIEPPDPIIEAGKELTNNSEKHKALRVQESRGQENLESLCRLMEEIAVLKDQNIKLTERLNYMEVRL